MCEWGAVEGGRWRGDGHRGRAALRVGERNGHDIKGPALSGHGHRGPCVPVCTFYFCTCCSEEEATYFNLSETSSDTEGDLLRLRKANAVNLLDWSE